MRSVVSSRYLLLRTAVGLRPCVRVVASATTVVPLRSPGAPRRAPRADLQYKNNWLLLSYYLLVVLQTVGVDLAS